MRMSTEIPLIEKGMLKKESRCLAESERYHLQILPDGKAYPCAIAASYNRPIADLNKTRITDIWDNPLIWNNYWDSLSDFFREKNNAGYCVDFPGFMMQDYKEKYDLVCPLRKFSPGEIACKESS
jgi:MoaA/NifB/PqqE/SkfB family radical SAM enzyme